MRAKWCHQVWHHFPSPAGPSLRNSTFRQFLLSTISLMFLMFLGPHGAVGPHRPTGQGPGLGPSWATPLQPPCPGMKYDIRGHPPSLSFFQGCWVLGPRSSPNGPGTFMYMYPVICMLGLGNANLDPGKRSSQHPEDARKEPAQSANSQIPG